MGQSVQELHSGQNMLVKTSLLCLLFLAPAILTFKLNAPQSAESELARQFNDDPVINYGIWGFIAGLTDYFVRNGITKTTTTTTTTTTPTTTTTTTTAAPRRKHFRTKHDKKEKQEKKKEKKLKREQRKKQKIETEAMKNEEKVKEVEETVEVAEEVVETEPMPAEE